MAVREEAYRQYIIPENFAESGRIFNGMFETRRFVEATVLAVISGFIAFLIYPGSIISKLPYIVLHAVPFFFLGLAGYNGDCASEAIKYIVKWRKSRGIMLYNNNTRFLEEAPLDVMMSEKDIRDFVYNLLEVRKQKKLTENQNLVFIEGENFEFASDDGHRMKVVDLTANAAINSLSLIEEETDISAVSGENDAKEDAFNPNIFIGFDNLESSLENPDEEDIITVKLRYELKNITEEVLY